MSATTARLERHGLKADEVISRLDGFYCYNVSVSLWADAVANRLEGLALYLLNEELAEVAQDARAAAAKLAAHIGDLGGAVTAHPGELADRFPRRLQGPSELRRPCGDSRRRSVEPGRHHRRLQRLPGPDGRQGPREPPPGHQAPWAGNSSPGRPGSRPSWERPAVMTSPALAGCYHGQVVWWWLGGLDGRRESTRQMCL